VWQIDIRSGYSNGNDKEFEYKFLIIIGYGYLNLVQNQGIIL